MFNDKKGFEMSYVVRMILLLIVLTLLIFGFRSLFSKETGTFKEKINDLEVDCDNDGIVNALDRCCGRDSSPSKVNIYGCEPGQEDADDRITCIGCKP